MATIEEAAQQFKAWAADEGVLNYDLPLADQVEFDDLDESTDVSVSQSAIDILKHRKINLVAVNEETNSIIVVTHQKITQKEIDSLPTKTDDGFNFEYIKGHPPRARTPQSTSVTGSTFYLHNGRYTCGSSISVGNEISAGTLGCLVKDQAGNLFGLTNNHVTGGCGYIDPDFPVVAPGLIDVRAGGYDPFTIGHHAKISPWISGTPENADVSGNLDVAIFKIKDANSVSSMQRDLFDTPVDVIEQRVNIAVEKVGRTTGRTRGTVIGRSVGFEPVFMQVNYFKGRIYFTELLLVKGVNNTAFSEPGDSGSLVCFRPAQGEPKALGILFAGSQDQNLSFVIPIKKVLDYFGVSLVSQHHV